MSSPLPCNENDEEHVATCSISCSSVKKHFIFFQMRQLLGNARHPRSPLHKVGFEKPELNLVIVSSSSSLPT